MTRRAFQRPATVLWLAVFLYAALAALLVQTVVLPRWAPTWHAGHGLLLGLDAVSYHDWAVDWGKAIRADGWTAWSLRPGGHVPVGITSAVYAATVAEPWALIPLGAALHATAAVALFRILEIFAPPRIALWGVLPFVLFPSALTWYAQIGKDGFAVLGALLVALGWARIARTTADPGASLGRGLLTIGAGAGVAWLARPYILDVLLGLGIVLAALVTGVALAGLVRGRWSAPTAGRALVRAWAAALAIWPLVALPGTVSYFDPPTRPLPGHVWTRSTWLPPAIDRRVEALARVRRGYLVAFPKAGSNMDPEVTLSSAGEVAAYLPRALQITLFAPFPSHWVHAGVNPGATVMRRLAGGEMLVFYLAAAALPWALWRWRERLELHVLVGFGLGMMLVHALAVPNLGALYRFRYPFATLLIGLAVATTLTRRKPAVSAPKRGAAVDGCGTGSRWPGLA